MYFLKKNEEEIVVKRQLLLGIISYGRDGIERNGTTITNNKNTIMLRAYI